FRDAHAQNLEVAGNGASDSLARDRKAHGGVHSCRCDVRRRGRDRRVGSTNQSELAAPFGAARGGDGRIRRDDGDAVHDLRPRGAVSDAPGPGAGARVSPRCGSDALNSYKQSTYGYTAVAWWS